MSVVFVASIPSPSQSYVELGPLTIRAYGLMIAFGVIAAVWLSQKRWEARGGNRDDITSLAMWSVPAGLVGSRVYHVFTDWRFDEGWLSRSSSGRAVSASRAAWRLACSSGSGSFIEDLGTDPT